MIWDSLGSLLNMASIPAAAAGVPAVRLSSVVRQILLANSNNPIRLNALWEQVKTQHPELVKSKTHFSSAIIGNMLVRDEVRQRSLVCIAIKFGTYAIYFVQLVKERVQESRGKDKVRLVYGYRLKGCSHMRRTIQRTLGQDVNFAALRATATAPKPVPSSPAMQ